MPTTYSLAPDDVRALVRETMRAHHPDLAEAGVAFGILFAENPDGDPVKAHGYPALACVRVVPLRDRLTKGYDVELLIDLHAWDGLRPEHRAAVVDHELTHVRRVPNSPKAVAAGELPWKTDDLGRPRVKLRKGDWAVGDGFEEVTARHGEFAAEFLNVQRALALARAAKERGEQDRREAA